jgi:hypothetical protein
MNRDSRHTDRHSDRFAEQFSELDSGLRIEQPKVDWAGVAAKRRANRRLVKSIAGSAAVLCLILPVVWYANRSSDEPVGTRPSGSGREMAGNSAETIRAEAKQELLAMDRELSQLNRRIASLQRKERSRKANLKTAAILKALPPEKSDYSDPVEEGALVMLAAAEKAAQKNGKEAGLALYRRVVEIFPSSRSAEIARRELM